MQLPIPFFLQNFHFALDLFFALVCFAIFWLNFDAWTVAKKKRDLTKAIGFFLLSLSFVAQSTIVEEAFFGQGLLGNYAELIAIGLRILGYLGIIYSLVTDPLPVVPKVEGLGLKKNTPAIFPGIFVNLKFLLPIQALIIALLFYRRATAGLERHLKQIAFGFFFLTLAESFFLATLLRGSSNVDIANISASFGFVWIAEQICLLISGIILGRWVWSYLVERLQSQLFMIFTSFILLIFLVVSVTFSYLLVNNITQASLADLETATKLLNYSIDSKKSEISSAAEVYSQNPDVISAVKAKDHNKLVELLKTSLTNRKTSSVIITNAAGQVLIRAEDPDDWGGSISADPLVKKALAGREESNYTIKEGVQADVINLASARPISSNGQIVGSVIVSLELSNHFLDGVKNSTGLDSAVYAGNQRSATTFLAQNSNQRLIGVEEQSINVNQTVLKEGEVYKGSVGILSRPYLVVFQPLKNINNDVIGMTLTAHSQVSILRAAGSSIEAIFILSSVLLLLSVIPAFFISRHISRQLR